MEVGYNSDDDNSDEAMMHRDTDDDKLGD